MAKKEESKSIPISAPEDNVKPLDYKEQFSVRWLTLLDGTCEDYYFV